MTLARSRGITRREDEVKVQEVMTREPSCVTPETPVREAARIMKSEDVGVVPVVKGEGSKELVGVITDRDIAIRVVADGQNVDVAVRQVMSADRLATVNPDADIDDVMDRMASEQVRRIPIVDERGELVGIVSQADVVRKAKDEGKAEDTVERISQPGGRHSQ
jgi:CBS domain-containing protein